MLIPLSHVLYVSLNSVIVAFTDHIYLLFQRTEDQPVKICYNHFNYTGLKISNMSNYFTFSEETTFSDSLSIARLNNTMRGENIMLYRTFLCYW